MESEKIYEIILSVLSGEASDTEQEFLKQWLEESQENKKEFSRIETLYRISKSKEKNIDFNTDLAWGRIHRLTFGKSKVFSVKRLLRYAAMVAVLIATGTFFFTDVFRKEKAIPILTFEDVNQPTLLLDNGEKIALNEQSFTKHQKDFVIKNEAKDKLVYESGAKMKEKKEQSNHLLIPHGTTYQVILADGTRVWLNSESEFSYPSSFNGDKREVTLQGEAFFEVAKDTGKPFIVRTEGMEVKVLGTSFNISCYKNEDGVSTTLVEGSVEIKTENGEEEILSPAERYTYNRIEKTTLLTSVNTDIYTSWLDGIYIFRDTPLSYIFKCLQRWHQFTLNYEDESLKNKRYSFDIDRNTSIDNILEVISFTSDIQLERNDTIINIKKKRRE